MASNGVDAVKRFLTVLADRRREPPLPEGLPAVFITISRQTGAGGHTLAEALLAELARHAKDPLCQDWQVWDRELCTVAVSDPGLKTSLPELFAEEFRSPLEDLVHEQITGSAPQDVVLNRIFRLMRGLAAAGRVILIGRGSACVTREHAGGVHLRLVAPEPARVRRMMTLLQLPEREARRHVEKLDAARAHLVQGCFDWDIDDPLLYDATWNTDRVPPAMIARAALDLVAQRAAELRRAVPEVRHV